MSSENDSKKKDEIDASERVLALAMERHADSAKLLKTKEELLTPKGQAEAMIVDCVENAKECLKRLLTAEVPEGDGPGAMTATAALAKTQLAAAIYVLDSAMNMVPAGKGGAARDVAQRIQAQSLGATLAARLAAEQQRGRGRPRIVEAALPAASSDTHSSEAHAANGVSVAANGGESDRS